MSKLHDWAKLLGGEVRGDQVLCPGPGHSASDRSLAVKVGRDGEPICFSHCGDDPLACKDYARDKLGLPPFKATYEFRDPASGQVRYRKERVEAPDGRKSFAFHPRGRNGSEPLLYGGERLADIVGSQVVFIVEGEKKVDRLLQLREIAVSLDSGSSSKWLPSHAELLRGLHVVLWPDSDDPGEKYVARAAECLRGAAASIKVVRPFGLPNGAKGRDVCDWDGGESELAALVADAEPYDRRSSGEAGGQPAPAPPSRVIGAGTFMRSYEPISYTIDGMLPSGYLYGLTGRQGTGKTAFKQAATIAIALNRPDVIGCDVEPGRVGYVTIENPIDFKMKFAVNCFAHNISYDEIEPRVAIIDGRDTPEQIYAGLKLDAEVSGPFQLVCFDTFQAGFAAANAGAFNENEAVLKYVGRLRPLTILPGSPSVLVAFHPIKNATEEELLPYGGGATMNEIDGNLTLWNAAQLKLHWNRVRGPQFEPKYFRIEKLSCPDILDNKGRQILLPVLRPCTEADAAEREKNEGNLDVALLRAMAANPDGTQLEWAFAIGIKAKSAINARLQKLKMRKIVEVRLDGKWRLTPKGDKELKL